MEYIIKYFKLAVCFAALLIALSGVYRVESSQSAVVLRFGRLLGETPERQIKKPGLHYALPFFIDKVIKIPVYAVQEREIAADDYVITGDKNMVLIKAKVKYQISDPARYTLFISDAGVMIDGIIGGELTGIAAHSNVDAILTSGRAQLSLDVMRNAQAIIDKLRLGVVISNVELTEITAPAETIRYFEEVRNAAVFKATSLQRAQEYASTRVLGAQAAAGKLKQAAVSEQAAQLTKARGEMAQFDGLRDQYARNPQIIVAGTFRRRAGEVLQKAGKSIVVPTGAQTPTILAP
jgi:membrane protease subunit HflK